MEGQEKEKAALTRFNNSLNIHCTQGISFWPWSIQELKALLGIREERYFLGNSYLNTIGQVGKTFNSSCHKHCMYVE